MLPLFHSLKSIHRTALIHLFDPDPVYLIHYFNTERRHSTSPPTMMDSPSRLSRLQQKLFPAREKIHNNQKTQGIKAAFKDAWRSLSPAKTRKIRFRDAISQPTEYRADPTLDGDFDDPTYLIATRAAPFPCPPRPTKANEVSKWSPDTPEDHIICLVRTASDPRSRRLSMRQNSSWLAK